MNEYRIYIAHRLGNLAGLDSALFDFLLLNVKIDSYARIAQNRLVDPGHQEPEGFDVFRIEVFQFSADIGARRSCDLFDLPDGFGVCLFLGTKRCRARKQLFPRSAWRSIDLFADLFKHGAVAELSGPGQTPFAQTRELACRLLDRQPRCGNATLNFLDRCEIGFRPEPSKGKPVVADPALRPIEVGLTRLAFYQTRPQSGLLRFEGADGRVGVGQRPPCRADVLLNAARGCLCFLKHRWELVGTDFAVRTHRGVRVCLFRLRPFESSCEVS
jgi:hypothetical protein